VRSDRVGEGRRRSPPWREAAGRLPRSGGLACRVHLYFRLVIRHRRLRMTKGCAASLLAHASYALLKGCGRFLVD
jgi:hypothetical protein